MGMIASFRFKKAESRFTKSRNYFIEMERLVTNLSGAAGEGLNVNPLFEKRNIKKKALVVMTGDKGLCGAYNSNLLKMATLWLKDNAAFSPVIIPAAKVANDFFRRKHLPTILGYPEKAMADLALAKKMTQDLKTAFSGGQVDSIEILYAAYRAGTPGRPQIVPFLSLSYLTAQKTAQKEEAAEYIYEPDLNTVFISILSCYLEGKIYMTLLESLTSESSARMLAMTQATDNAEEVLDHLKLLRNKTRQATITRELSEIVAGANVLI